MRFSTPPIDFYLLHDTRSEGQAVAYYDGHPVAESVVDAYGRHFLFAGVAPRRNGGRFDLAALRDGEFILMPGLVYRWDKYAGR